MTIEDVSPISKSLASLGESQTSVSVELSYELIGLLSEQLYNSPLKALEELVVNSFDADAQECRIFLPLPGDERKFIVVYDDGIGMDATGLTVLWMIGRSEKRQEAIQRARKRKQIGKFGIGKLATYAIANRITYLTKSHDTIRTVTLHYGSFAASASGGGTRVALDIEEIAESDVLASSQEFRALCDAVGVDSAEILRSKPSWTFVILEDLKEKAGAIQLGRLHWVLATAMPAVSDFELFLNGSVVESSKVDIPSVVRFSVQDLSDKRIGELNDGTKDNWRIENGRLISDSLPSGVAGEVIVAERSLYAGKSSDLGRSHGFFLRVRHRLLNQDDPLFGLRPLSYETFNRFRAELEVDDLDNVVKAPREDAEESHIREVLEALLRALFNEARERYLEAITNRRRREHENERVYVSPRLLERPIADVLSNDDVRMGAEADSSWFYMALPTDNQRVSVVNTLYSASRTKYRYRYAQLGPNRRVVSFDPADNTFTLNEDHEFIQAHADPRSRALLEDVVTAEALLEIYLHEQNLAPAIIGEILEYRDGLLRSLAKDHPVSVTFLSSSLMQNAADEVGLEIAVVAAMRSMGFVATHLGDTGAADGLAKFAAYPPGETTITLEAKSSIGTPSLGHLDFAALVRHREANRAAGVLLVAPGYPDGNNPISAVATQAKLMKISCWTVEQLARVLAAAETRHLNAKHVLDIVLNSFAPSDVTEAVGKLFAEPAWEQRELYSAILEALAVLRERLPGSPRTVGMLATEISRSDQFAGIKEDAVDSAIRQLAGASQGLLSVSRDRVILAASIEEVSNRLTSLTGGTSTPRRLGTFREP
jgi:hypothetical protein